MRETIPQIHLIMRPEVDWHVVRDYLRQIGGEGWQERVYPHNLIPNPSRKVASDGELLTEFVARGCYRSYVPGINANVTKVREDSGEYLANILESRHGSVLEHASYTFIFQDVSRVFTHELVRHRAGVAISQESLRYVRLTDIGFRVPAILKPLHSTIVSIVEQLEDFQVNAAEMFGLDNDGVPFAIKKEITSALRRLAPIGLSTTIFWTANIRTLRHVIEMRTAPSAEEEIRLVFAQVARVMHRECPLLFGDFFDERGDLRPPRWSKV